ncbi:DUF6428 family protein [Salegentibacter chungangensis]|uniref:DUF6428 family protein n=1 Tax=Salegentibacter chungangensis TaxID=1335724 RepID=A0ABW3NRJ0_9FLAO
MKIGEVKNKLKKLKELKFELPDGRLVPEHFHVTEVGLVSRKFIDCGANLREEKMINFQLFAASDYDHKLPPGKFLSIIEKTEEILEFDDLEVEVEYQGDTIGRYGLELAGENFRLVNKHTDCLAKDKCGIPKEKPKLKLSEMRAMQSSCAPGSGCC